MLITSPWDWNCKKSSSRTFLAWLEYSIICPLMFSKSSSQYSSSTTERESLSSQFRSQLSPGRREAGDREKYLVTESRQFLSTITFRPCFSLNITMTKTTLSGSGVLPENKEYHVGTEPRAQSPRGEVKEESLFPGLACWGPSPTCRAWVCTDSTEKC